MAKPPKQPVRIETKIRDAGNGQFITKAEAARKNPDTYEREKIKFPKK